MRAWWLAGWLSLFGAAPLLAATPVTIRELKARPAAYYNETVSVECYYDKESPIWVSALPSADEWIGFFVTGAPDKALTWAGEYYNLFFAPREMQEVIRELRGGDKITLIGEGFHYQSASLDGLGVRVRQVLRGWGAAAKTLGGGAPVLAFVPAASAAPSPPPPTTVTQGHPQAETTEKLVVTINGKRYDGLRVGDRYNFDGIEFQIDKAQ